jgi:FkbM family methyltransferase
MKSLVWTMFRRWRLAWASLTQNNRFIQQSEPLDLHQEWQSVRNLLQARESRIHQVSIDAEGYVCFETPLGPFWAPPGSSDYYIRMLLQEIQSGTYMIDGSIAKDATFLDCGANIGFFTRFAISKGAPKVIAFEPAPQTALCLRRNLAKEIADGRVVVIEKGVWDEETTLSFSTASSANPGSNHIVEDGPGDIKVPVTTIDVVCEEFQVHRLAYIKMDIEGAELSALKGGQQSRGCKKVCVNAVLRQ